MGVVEANCIKPDAESRISTRQSRICSLACLIYGFVFGLGKFLLQTFFKKFQTISSYKVFQDI